MVGLVVVGVVVVVVVALVDEVDEVEVDVEVVVVEVDVEVVDVVKVEELELQDDHSLFLYSPPLFHSLLPSYFPPPTACGAFQSPPPPLYGALPAAMAKQRKRSTEPR